MENSTPTQTGRLNAIPHMRPLASFLSTSIIILPLSLGIAAVWVKNTAFKPVFPYPTKKGMIENGKVLCAAPKP
jgi:hypothetical protein